MSAAESYEFTPGAVARAAYRGGPEQPEHFPDLEERRAALLEFRQAHGQADARGVPTAAYLATIERAEQHQRNLHGADWLQLSEAEERQLVQRMRSAGIAAAAAESARPFGPADLARIQAEAGERVPSVHNVHQGVAGAT